MSDLYPEDTDALDRAEFLAAKQKAHESKWKTDGTIACIAVIVAGLHRSIQKRRNSDANCQALWCVTFDRAQDQPWEQQ